MARCLDKMNQSIPSSLKHRLYLYQGFNTLLSSYWNLDTYIQHCQQGEEMEENTLAAVLKKMSLKKYISVNNTLINNVFFMVKKVCEHTETPTAFKSCFGNLNLEELN